jgi:hypothetical protein
LKNTALDSCEGARGSAIQNNCSITVLILRKVSREKLQ